jgi:tRNA-2-methylthio-N6-dimethylallyladenosine synthase
MPSVFIKTYGCQMNERDSEAVAAQLVAKGYRLAASEHVADVVLLNTCSVRDMAERKALGKMKAVIGQARKTRPGQVFGFLGCMAQSRGQELIDQLPDVDLVLGTQKFHRAADYLDDLLAGRRGKIVDTAAEEKSEATIREHLLAANGHKAVTAFVSIMQGCNQHCTFCIVPSTRGEERSRSIADIAAECRDLVSRGVKDITLLGQIVTSYGKRDYPAKNGKSAFVQLLEAIHDIEGLERIRFTSPHPKGYGEDLIELWALPKLGECVPAGAEWLGSHPKPMHRATLVSASSASSTDSGGEAGIGVPRTSSSVSGRNRRDLTDLLLCREVEFDLGFLFKYSQWRDTAVAAMLRRSPRK